MKLHILSDLHRDLAGDIEIPATDADVVLLAGDIDKGIRGLDWALETFKIPTLFVLGNHETGPGNSAKLKQFRHKCESSWVRVLEHDVLEMNAVRFLGCTLWSPANKKMRACLDHSIEWLDQSLRENDNGKTVVITHYPPLRQSLPHEVRIDEAFAKRISVDLHELISSSHISLWVHGHIHKHSDYTVNQTRIICNPRGYTDSVESKFLSDLVIEI